jgi:hypothetical protein
MGRVAAAAIYCCRGIQLHRDAEIFGKMIERAERHDSQGHAGFDERSGNGPDCAIATPTTTASISPPFARRTAALPCPPRRAPSQAVQALWSVYVWRKADFLPCGYERADQQ